MSKAEEATNDFCTRCFKYDRCIKVQSECIMADSYQEGYEDGHHQAEKDLALTWEDMRKICTQSVLVEFDLGRNVTDERHYTEVLNRFNKQKEK